MSHRIVALILTIGVILSAHTAIAGPCAVDVAQFRATLTHGQSRGSAIVGSAPQSISAQLRHQPTPASVEHAEKSALDAVATTLAEAEKLDADGKQSACEDALARAKLLANP